MNYRVGHKLRTTIYRDGEDQPCAWVPGDAGLAARIVLALEAPDAKDARIAELESDAEFLTTPERVAEIIGAKNARIAELEADGRRIDWLAQWLTDNPRAFQLALRRLESTGEFICGLWDSPMIGGNNNYHAENLRAAIDAALKADA